MPIPEYPEKKVYKTIDDEKYYARNVAVLGKLGKEVVQPWLFASGTITNFLTVIFLTKQEVGTAVRPLAQIWLGAPVGYDFSQYCIVLDMEDIYYVPEPEKPTTRLPRETATSPIACSGAEVEGTSPTPGTYNEARIGVQGRLLVDTVYGFEIRIRNAPLFKMEHRSGWKIWTYENDGKEPIDASEYSPRFNQESLKGADLSWASYLEDFTYTHDPVANLIRSTGFEVVLGDTRPNALRTPTDITVFPIILQTAIEDPVRIRVLAPHGYAWKFIPDEFLYESALSGVQAHRAVPGVEVDLPLSLIPPMPMGGKEPRPCRWAGLD